MQFTFGIITDGTQDSNIEQIINSIESQEIPKDKFEIIIIGSSRVKRKNTIIVPFEENIKPRWITKKKNLITELAKFENIVFLHDYIILNPNWYLRFQEFGNDFDICMTRMINNDGTRYRDWTLDIHKATELGIPLYSRKLLLPYDIKHLSKYQYISGAYWIAKRQIMRNYRLDEDLCWGQGEDIKWSMEVNQKYKFSINKMSSVFLLKQSDPAFLEIKEDEDKELIQRLKNFNGSKSE